MQKWIDTSYDLFEMIFIHLPTQKFLKNIEHYIYMKVQWMVKIMMARDLESSVMMFISKIIPSNYRGRF